MEPVSLTGFLTLITKRQSHSAYRHCGFQRIQNAEFRGVAWGEFLGCPWLPLGRPSFEQTTDNIQVAKTPWQYLGRKSHCWKAYFFNFFFLKYFHQRLLSLVNMGLRAAIIRLSPLIHEGEQRYEPRLGYERSRVGLSDRSLLFCLW